VGAYALDTGLALLAGAGTGKTHALMTLCLHLLGGARVGGALRPGQLCLVTFTEKAAGELRQRLKQRVSRLAEGGDLKAVEPELFESFAAVGRPAPRASTWKKILEELGSAYVGTFHALALELLRTAPRDARTEDFELLDEEEARRLVEDVAESVVLDALDAGDAGVAALVEEVDFGGRGDGFGLYAALLGVHTRVREDGVDPLLLPIGDATLLRSQFDEALARARALAGDAVGLEAAEGRGLGAEVSELRRLVEGATWESFTAQAERVDAFFAREPKIKKVRKDLGECVKALRLALEEALGLHAAASSVPFEATFRTLLAKLARAHEEELDREGVLDFSSLMLRARNLLRDSPAALRAARSRFGAFLVDEVQDTNEVQWELLQLLARQEVSSATGQLDMALGPGAAPICVVGDAKQSIYEFRGANVSILERAAQWVEASGGRRSHLQHNRRSQEGLLAFFNGVFQAVLQPGGEPRDFQVAYRAETDDLKPVRRRLPAAQLPPVERLLFDATDKRAAECRALEAEALATRLAELLGPNGPKVVEEAGVLRQVRPGEVAVLFQRLTQVEVYRQALLRHGISHRVVRGRGFYAAQEVLDVASLLTLWGDPGDKVALAAVLRSPFVGVTDATLLRLWRHRRGFELDAVRRWEELGPALPDGEGQRLARFLGWFEPLREAQGVWPLERLLREAFDASELLARLAASPEGAQAVANVEKLLGLAERWARAGKGDGRQLAEHLLDLADSDPLEAVAELGDAAEAGLVQLLTVHQSKGLEWPVLCVADLAAAPTVIASGAFIYERRVGLAMGPELYTSSRETEVLAELKHREDAESMRRLYVALTRARDRLILSGQSSRQSGKSWRTKLDALIETPALQPLVMDVPSREGERAPGPTRLLNSPGDVERAQAAEIIAQVRRPDAWVPRRVPGALLEEAGRCPRWAWLALHGRSAERGEAMGPEVGVDEVRESGVSVFFPQGARARVRSALSRIDYTLHAASSGEREAHVTRLLASEGFPRDSAPWRTWQGLLLRLLESPLAARVARAAQVGAVARDWAYVVPVDAEKRVEVEGRVDLLLAEEGRRVAVHFGLDVESKASTEHYGHRLLANRLAVERAFPGAEVSSLLWAAPESGKGFQEVSLEKEPSEPSALGLAAAPLANLRPERPPAPIAQARCECLGCPLIARCHGGGGPAL
jgi:ATP-dependent exoDNAse (exonuclease V) beta subunit